jgi:hypothetical protein
MAPSVYHAGSWSYTVEPDSLFALRVTYFATYVPLGKVWARTIYLDGLRPVETLAAIVEYWNSLAELSRKVRGDDEVRWHYSIDCPEKVGAA